MRKRSCPQCGQDLRLQPDAYIQMKWLEKYYVAVERVIEKFREVK